MSVPDAMLRAIDNIVQRMDRLETQDRVTASAGTAADTVASETAYGLSPSAGVATTYARGDHTHGSPASGGGLTAADTVAAETSFGIPSAAGVAATYSRGDHTHGTPADPLSYSASVVTEMLFGQSQAVGVANTVSRGDHSHGTPTMPYGTPAITLGTTPDAGISLDLIRADARIVAFDATVPTTIQPDDAAAAGSAAYAARRDHSHAIACGVPGTILPDASAAEGTSTSFARADHAHAIAAAAATTLSVSTTNAEGTGNDFARATHLHTITSSSNPGAAASLLASDASGYLQLIRLGLNATPLVPLHIQVTGEALRLADDADSYAAFTMGANGALTITTEPSGNLTLSPDGMIAVDPSPDGADHNFLPVNNYEVNLGSLSKKYLTLHAAELWVETLVAQETIATIGGRILVGPTTELTTDLSAAAGGFSVKHNQLAISDVVYLEANGAIEFMRIYTQAITGVSAASDYFDIAGDYTTTYTVGRTFTVRDSTGNDGEWTVESVSLVAGPTTRIVVTGDIISATADGHIAYRDSGPYSYWLSRDLDGTGANDWPAGSAVFNTGNTGDGFIDIYSVSGVNDAVHYGPTIVGNVRTGTGYADWTEHWALGNLDGLYGYGADTYGAAFGKYAAGVPWVSLDATNGFRVMRGTTPEQLAQWDTSGNILIGKTGAGQSNVYITAGAVKLRNNTTSVIDLLAAADDYGRVAIFEGVMGLGTSGGIYQGTGTFASPASGLKIYNSGGQGLIELHYGSTKALSLDYSGLHLYGDAAGSAHWITWNNISGKAPALYGYGDATTGYMTVLSHASTGAAYAQLASRIDFGYNLNYVRVYSNQARSNSKIELAFDQDTAGTIHTFTASAVTLPVATLTVGVDGATAGNLYARSATAGQYGRLTWNELLFSRPSTNYIDLSAISGTLSLRGSAAGSLDTTIANFNVSYTALYQDARIGGGLYVGGTGVAPAAGDVWALNDGRFGGGLYVGSTGTGAATGEVVTTSHIKGGSELYLGGQTTTRYWQKYMSVADEGATVIYDSASHAYGLTLINCQSEFSVCLASYVNGTGWTIIHQSPNDGRYVTTDTDGYHCLLDNGTYGYIKNRRGAAVAYRIHWFN